MSFTKYTTQELEFIVSNFKHLERELKKRQIKELDSFPFKVGDVVHTKNDDDNFIVEVTVKPLDFMSGVEEEATEILTDELLKMTEFPSDDELMKLTFDLMYDLVAEKVENPTYGDATTVVLRLEVNEENEYEINEDDFVALDNSLYSSEY